MPRFAANAVSAPRGRARRPVESMIARCRPWPSAMVARDMATQDQVLRMIIPASAIKAKSATERSRTGRLETSNAAGRADQPGGPVTNTKASLRSLQLGIIAATNIASA